LFSYAGLLTGAGKGKTPYSLTDRTEGGEVTALKRNERIM